MVDEIRLRAHARPLEQAAGQSDGEQSSGQSSLDHGRCSGPLWRPDDLRPVVAPK
jgi:hypothetical protein